MLLRSGETLMEIVSPYFTTKEAAAYLKCHPKTLSRMAKKGKIKAKKIGCDYRFHIDDLDARSK